MSELDETELLVLAARASGAGRLDDPHGTADVRNPFCGDRLTLDLRLEGEVVAEIGYRIRACLVCQASASILGDKLLGETVSDIAEEGARVRDFLNGDGDAPDAFEVFEKVKPHRNRHVCVDMPFQAVAEAAANAKDRS